MMFAGSWWHVSIGVGLTMHINPLVFRKKESLILHIRIAPVREPRGLCCKHYSAIVWSIAKDETQITMHVHFICTSCIQGTVEAYYMPCKFPNHVLQLFFSLHLLCTGPENLLLWLNYDYLSKSLGSMIFSPSATTLQKSPVCERHSWMHFHQSPRHAL